MWDRARKDKKLKDSLMAGVQREMEWQQEIARWKLDAAINKAKHDCEQNRNTARNWTGLYIYPGLREEKKENA